MPLPPELVPCVAQAKGALMALEAAITQFADKQLSKENVAEQNKKSSEALARSKRLEEEVRSQNDTIEDLKTQVVEANLLLQKTKEESKKLHEAMQRLKDQAATRGVAKVEATEDWHVDDRREPSRQPLRRASPERSRRDSPDPVWLASPELPRRISPDPTRRASRSLEAAEGDESMRRTSPARGGSGSHSAHVVEGGVTPLPPGLTYQDYERHAVGLNIFSPKYNTELCRHFRKGFCKLGSLCQFAHGDTEKQVEGAVPPQRLSYQDYVRQTVGPKIVSHKYCAEVCRHFSRGLCKLGSQCNFAHRDAEKQV